MGKKKKKVTKTYSPKLLRVCSISLRIVAVLWFIALGIPTFFLGYAGFSFLMLIVAMVLWMMGSSCSKLAKEGKTDGKDKVSKM